MVQDSMVHQKISLFFFKTGTNKNRTIKSPKSRKKLSWPGLQVHNFFLNLNL